MTESKPLLIALEGIDNAGKTTIIQKLEAEFGQTLGAVMTKELTSFLGPYIKDGLRQSGLSAIDKVLLFAADRHLRWTKILQTEPVPRILLADRWVYSAIAYRCADNFELASYVEEVNRVFPNPDLTIFIDITASESLSRGEETYTESYLDGVRAQYHRLVDERGLVRVDGMKSASQVHAQVRGLVLNELRRQGIRTTE